MVDEGENVGWRLSEHCDTFEFELTNGCKIHVVFNRFDLSVWQHSRELVEFPGSSHVHAGILAMT